jgi:hypothetical protein
MNVFKPCLFALRRGIIGIGFLVLGLSSPALGQGAGSDPHSAIQNTLANIQTQLNSLQTSVNNLTTEMSNVQTDLSTLQTDVTNLSTEVDLRSVTQNWDKKLDASNGDPATGCNSDRFTCLFGETVVRDNETGLVWERDLDPDPDTRSWISAINHCANREVGGRKGWQLPLREQLATLVDRSKSNPALPTGHPFLNVQSDRYWSATTDASSPTIAWNVGFGNGGLFIDSKVTDRHAWCVRGGQGFDGNTHNTLH